MIKKNVMEPTEWVSTMHIVHKPNGKLHVCLDTHNINKVIQHEYYKCSKLYTFTIPFSRYRYQRLPFEISTAPEICHEMIRNKFEGMENVETSMDDMVIWRLDRVTPTNCKEIVKQLQTLENVPEQREMLNYYM